MRRGVVLAVALSTMAAASPARANPALDEARAALQDLRYDLAGDALARALRAGASGPAELAEIHRLSAEVAAVLGRADDAQRHFRAALSLAPDTALPAGTSPKIAEPFEAARRALGGRALRVETSARASPPTLVVSIVDDPATLVRGARAEFRGPGGPWHADAAGGPRFELVPGDAAGAQDVSGALLDEHGNRVAELGPIAIPIAEAPAPTPERGRSLFARWWLWGGVAVAAAATGGAFGLAARNDRDELNALNDDPGAHDYQEFVELEDRIHRRAGIANASYAVAGACAVVSGILLVRDLRRSDDSPSVAPAPVTGGAGVTVVVRF
jgi:hypothetical protein